MRLGRPRIRRYPSGLQTFTLDLTVGASLDDGWSTGVPQFDATSTSLYVGVGATAVDSFARYTNVTIPGGATIQSAYITANQNLATHDGAGVKTNIYLEDADTAVAPTSRAEHAADVRTTAFTAWDDDEWAVDTDKDSPDIASVVQEVVDRGSWASGNAMMILWDDDGSDADSYYEPHSYDQSAGVSIRMHVEYTT